MQQQLTASQRDDNDDSGLSDGVHTRAKEWRPRSLPLICCRQFRLNNWVWINRFAKLISLSALYSTQQPLSASLIRFTSLSMLNIVPYVVPLLVRISFTEEYMCHRTYGDSVQNVSVEYKNRKHLIRNANYEYPNRSTQLFTCRWCQVTMSVTVSEKRSKTDVI